MCDTDADPKQVDSFGSFKLDDIVVRMDGGPSSIYKIVNVLDNGVCNIRVNTEMGLECHGSWVHINNLRLPTELELENKYRMGARTWLQN